MGNDKMDDCLIWMIYADSTGKNVTISPRLSYGHVEPSYTSNISVTALPGTGISNGNYTVYAMCSNCRSWKGGSIDPTNTAAKFIFAAGPDGSLNSNSFTEGIKRHASYGAFTMDLTKAYGIRGVPNLITADTANTVQTQDTTDHDFSAPLHAVVMITAFVGLMPLGVVILRILNSPRWHGYNQALSFAAALIGLFLGIYCGTMYNRVSNDEKCINKILTNFADDELQFRTSNLRHCHHPCVNRPIRAWIHAPPNLQEDLGYYQACPCSCLAWSSRHTSRCRQWIPRLPPGPQPEIQLGSFGMCFARHNRTGPIRVVEVAKKRPTTQYCSCCSLRFRWISISTLVNWRFKESD